MKINNKNAFPYKFPKNFKWSSFLCQKFIDLKSLQESSNLWELLISVLKMGGFFIRFLAKELENHKNETMKKLRFRRPIKSKLRFFKSSLVD